MTRSVAEEVAGLAVHDDVPAFIDGVLVFAQRLTGADIAYMAAGADCASPNPRWSRCAPAGAASTALEHLSSGVVQEALGREETVHTASALLDPRFMERPSVRRNQIGSVLCVTLGSVGVLYLHVRGRVFRDEDRDVVEHAASLLCPLLGRLIRDRRLDAADPTRPYRRALRADRLIGTSAPLATLLQQLTVCAPTRAPVLLLGETGTGKSTIARVIHDSSSRRGELVTVECTQLAPDRLVADLFGARAGSYTGIQRDSPGLVEAARQGTLFLDEVGELDLEAQARLLRFLQEKRYRWLGDPRDRTADDVRVIAATHVDLQAAVQDGRFRADLYYRLAVFPIRVPRLRERLDDLPFLAHELVSRAADELGVGALPIAPSALAVLESREWPGNLRELDNMLRRALLWANADRAAALRAEHLTREAAPRLEHAEGLHSAVLAFKRRLVFGALDAAGGNRTAAAARLGIGRSSLYELLAQFGAEVSGSPDGEPSAASETPDQ